MIDPFTIPLQPFTDFSKMDVSSLVIVPAGVGPTPKNQISAFTGQHQSASQSIPDLS